MLRISLCTAIAVLLAAPAQAAQAPDVPEPVEAIHVAGNVYIAKVGIRNSVFLVSDDKVLLAETNFDVNADALAGAIASVTDAPVTMTINTHWHTDHVDANGYFAERGAVTMAHENTRARMAVAQINPVTGGVRAPAHPPEDLPMVTVTEGATLRWGNENVDIIHYPDAHTDADLVLYYEDANVVFVGGLMQYPTYAGVHTPDGFVAALNAVIARSNPETKVIPWQGAVVSIAELAEWRDIIQTTADHVARMMGEGASVEEIVASRPTAAYDAKWGGGRAPDRFAEEMHYILTHGTRE